MNYARLAMAVAGLPLAAAAQVVPGPVVTQPQSTTWGRIVTFETGWSDDTMAVTLANVPVVNPSRCNVTSSYALDPAEPGNHTHQAALMGAYFNQKQVRLIVLGCVYNKPRIIGVAVQD
jgi:hypothetical protein